MKKVRQREIIELLRKSGNLSTEDIANHFKVSTQTIRRDMEELEEQGILIKMYGGATLVGYGEEEEASPFMHFPATDNQHAKNRIAEAAIQLIQDGTTVALDNGTTTRAMGEQLMKRNNLIIITRDVYLASSLFNHPTNKVYVIGGFVGERGDTAGAYAEEFLSTVSNIDFFLFGTDGVTVNEGFTSLKPGTEDYRTLFLSKSKTKIALADHTKMGQACFYRTCDISDADYLVTDSESEPALIKEVQASGINVIVA